jgi:DNA replicative helicase MCM subunit Mcm2 (Cdc46/Mcm family)
LFIACRHSHLNTLVRVHGVVTRRTGVFPQLDNLYYTCGACTETIGPLKQVRKYTLRQNSWVSLKLTAQRHSVY